MPLYIPNEEGYYKESFEIFEMCLFSILKTAISPIKVSVISGGSCTNVHAKLIKLYKEKHIDELVLERDNIGKINCILKALRTANERLITITDSDVLFLNNWENEVLNVFKTFPKAGMVCPVPVFRTHLRLTSNIWMRNLFSNKLKFTSVKNPEAMTRFANSIGWPWLDIKYKDVIATLKGKNNMIAVVGASHFVGTYKREVFNKLPNKNSIYVLGGDSEFKYNDEPVLKMGGFRLSTNDNYAYHMGNILEPWMEEIYSNLKTQSNVYQDFKELKILKSNIVDYFISEKIFKKLFTIKAFKKRVFKMKGLNKEQIKNYLS
ncbi:glycosyltransferase [Jejuia spongiicola]|uniref:Glycosyltransferase n=1 Tax=Jejuia spongiicola TaxID=2942207 RepID=A0ABT0QCI9_9FLAO|nr:glycosyltransferase [Jejuia spongiicola]MCL6294665.1 glycosyltransferase [Jejuia spongiicola]